MCVKFWSLIITVVHNVNLKVWHWVCKIAFLVGILFQVGLKFLKMSKILTHFQFFLFGKMVSLKRYLKANPRQMQLGMRCLQALQVQASPIFAK